MPSRRAGIPLAVVLGGLPVAYALLSSMGGERSAAPLKRADFRGWSGPALAADDPREERFAAMTAELEALANTYPAQVAIYLKDLQTGREWAYHADDLFPIASLIKVPIMAAVFEKIKRGDLSLNTRLRLRRSTRMGGSGTIKWKRDGTTFTVRKLLEMMAQNSDNTAMKILIAEVGMGFLQEYFPRLGLVYTEIYPEGLSLTSGRVRYENYTTAREISMLFERIYRGEMVDRFASELMLEILKGRRRRARLAKKLPVGWEIAHKTGLLRRACHDAGIVFTPDGDYILTVLTGRNRSYYSAKNFIANVGQVTYKHYKSDLSLYARAEGGSASASAR